MATHIDLSGKRVLVVPLRFLGDAVVTLPMLQTLKSEYPSAHVSVWCSNIGEQIFGASDAVDQCVREPKKLLQRFLLLQAGQYDVVILLRKSFTMALLCQWAGIPIRCGYDMQRFPNPIGFYRSGWGLTHVVSYPDEATPHHQAWHHVQHFKQLTGKSISVPRPRLALTDDIEKSVMQFIPSPDKPYVVVHGLSASASKCLNLSVFTPAVKALMDIGFQVLATGTSQDKNDLEDWIARDNLSVCSLAGQTTLLQLLALLKNAALLVGLDSGPVHLAGVSDTPVVALYGHTNPNQWGPLGDGGALADEFVPVSIHPEQSDEAIAFALHNAVMSHHVIRSSMVSS